MAFSRKVENTIKKTCDSMRKSCRAERDPGTYFSKAKKRVKGQIGGGAGGGGGGGVAG